MPKKALFTKWLFQKSTVLFGIGLMSFFVFNPTITKIIDKTIVLYLSSCVTKPALLFDIISIILIIVIILFYKSKRLDYVPSDWIAGTILLIFIFYFYYRFYNSRWEFVSFSFCNDIKYLDIIILICVLNSILWLSNWIKPNSCDLLKTDNLLFDDEPIEKMEEDQLGYHKYASLIVDKIEKSNFNRAFAIGVNAPWGMGKTSFINLITKSLNSEKNIVVAFNPWDCKNPEAIIQDFFSNLQEAIRPYHSSLTRKLAGYSNRLIKLNDGTIANTIQISIAGITGIDSVDKIHDEINTALREINKRVIITIDDIDRLSSNEVFEVLRLVRNTANFYNTFFLVAYDRNYVIQALKNKKTHKAETFLEKIFQIEITLPQFDKNILLKKFESLIKPHIAKNYHEAVSESVWGSSIFKPSTLGNSLNNIRDVTRLANAVVLNFTKLQGEVVFNDFLRLEALRLKYPVVYDMLFRKTDLILTTSTKRDNNYYVLKKIPNENNKSRYLIEDLLAKKCHETGTSNCDVEEILTLLSGVFGDDGNSFNIREKSVSHLSVINPSAFKRYFNYELLKDDLSEIDFSIARQSEFEDFIIKIDEWLLSGKYELVRQRLAEIKDFDNIEDFEKIIKAIFYFANKKVTDNGKSVTLRFDLANLVSKFYKIETKLYTTPELKAGLKDFIKGLFESAKDPYTFESDLVYYLSDELNNHLPLSREEFQDYAITYFRSFCEKHNSFNWDFWHLYHNTKSVEREDLGNGTSQRSKIISSEANDILKMFIANKDLDGFLWEVIELETFDQKTVAISRVVLDIFGDWNEFKVFLFKQDENRWQYLKEFKELFELFEKTGFKQYVKFKFSTIPIKTKYREGYSPE